VSRRLATSLTVSLSVFLTLVGAGLVGCGGSGDDDRPEDRAQIEALVAELNRAIETRDPQGWCTVFAPSSVEGTFGSVARCQQETAEVLKSGGSPERLQIAEIAFVDDAARVAFEGRAGDANVVLEGGSWFFSLDQQVNPEGEPAEGGDDGS
jgi:hypothetical protein